PFPSSTFPYAPRVIPDGRISRVRLATMTVPVRPSLSRRGSSAHSHPPRCATGLPRGSIAACRPVAPAQCPAWVTPRLFVMTESPFAPSRRYLLGSRVKHDFDQRYPILVALTGSCAVPRSSVSLCHKL